MTEKGRRDFCIECRKETAYTLHKTAITKIIRKKEYQFLITTAHCKECGCEVGVNGILDYNAKEIDVFVEQNNEIHPLEIKKSAAPNSREIKKYIVLDKAALARGAGGIICMCEEVIPIDEKNCFIPCNLI